MSRAIAVSLLVAACSAPPRGITPSDGNSGGDASANPDAAIDGAPDAPPDAPDASVGPFADPFGPLVDMAGLCSVDHWCWMAPTPAGNSYDHVFATAPDNIWLIGGKGTVLQWDGHAWHDRAPPVPANYQRWELAFSISGLGPNDMWLVIGGTLQHWNGSTWTIVDTGNYWAGNVWEAPNGEVWCTQSGNVMTHVVPNQGLTYVGVGVFAGNVGGIAADDFWVASSTNVVHYRSNAFMTEYSGSAIMGMIGAVARDDIWFGGSGQLVHYNAGTWTNVPTGLASNAFLIFVGANGSDDVTFMSGSTVLHWDGAALSSTVIAPSPATGYDAKIIDNKWWIVGRDGAVATLNNGVTQTLIDPTTWDLRPLWGSSANDMFWATTDYPFNVVRHWDGMQWSTLPIQATDLTGVHTASGNELFAAGSEPAADPTLTITDLWHFDGTTWVKSQPEAATATPRYVYKIWANGPGEAIAVGAKGFAYRYSAGTWTPLSTAETGDFRGIWGPDPDHAYLVATDNTVVLWNRANPNVLTTDTTFVPGGDQLGAIHGADGIVWIGVTNDGAARRGDVTGWTRVTTHVIGDAIWATSATDVVVTTTGSAVVARYNGTTWNLEDDNSWTAVGRYLYRPPGGPMYAVQSGLVVTHP